MQNLFRKTPQIPINPKAFANLPEGPGVYGYLKNKQPIYIGKAVNLRSRLKSYLTNRLEDKTRKMVSDAEAVSYIKVGSELEALLLEAELIRKYQPQYNVISKDDKHALYIRFTKEEYPKVLTCRKIETQKSDTKVYFGPFPSSTNVKAVLGMLRRIFPYSDHRLGKKPCLLSQIGLCNPCPSEIQSIKNYELRIMLQKKYLKNVSRIKTVLSGKFDMLERQLVKEMQVLSKNQKYEGAAYIKDKIEKLKYITQPRTPSEYYLENPNLTEDLRKKELNSLKRILNSHIVIPNSLRRIECFDVAHLSGVAPTASMVTFIDGEPAKEFYRHLKIRKAKAGDDIASLEEVASMRIKHLNDWGKPDLIIVDGGKGQVNVFDKILSKYGVPVAGLAKRYESLVLPTKNKMYGSFIVKRVPPGPALDFLQRARNEAHRFARRYHHYLFAKRLLA